MSRRRTKWTFNDADAVPAYRSNPPPKVRALTADDLEVVFQPIVRVATGTLFGHEALVRCRLPEFKNPEALFTHAHEQHASGHLGRVIREVACERCPDAPLFLNVHPSELSTRWLVRPDDPIGFHGHDIYLEITESTAFDYFDLCKGVLLEVCARTGAQLVVDDFGAGHSNLMRLLDLEPSVVKVDKALVSGLHNHRKKQLIISAIARLCEELGASVVAEGIEHVDELKAVADCGVQFAQGYLFAKPAWPPPSFEWPLPRPAVAPALALARIQPQPRANNRRGER